VTVDALEASVVAPTLNIVSPTPRAALFPPFPSTAVAVAAAHTPLPSPANSPFEQDLRTFTITPSMLDVPSSRRASICSASTASQRSSPIPEGDSSPQLETAPAFEPAPAPRPRRRRSTAADIHERRPKKGDEDYIKRPENAFILFRRKCVEDRNAGLAAAAEDRAAPLPKRQRQADLSKTISAQWKSLPVDEKQYWEDLAKERKKAHAEQYPGYVYRPVRVKKSQSPSKGKGKGKAAPSEDEGTDDDALKFTLPVQPPRRTGVRAGSAPTPPPLLQHIVLPALSPVHLHPISAPDSPFEVASIARRASNASDFSDMDVEGGDSDWFATSFARPQGWAPPPSSDADSCAAPIPRRAAPPADWLSQPFGPFSHAHTYGAPGGLSVETDMDMLCLPSMTFDGACATSSSGASSPHIGPYTPGGALEIAQLQLPSGADLWQTASLDGFAASEPPCGFEPAYPFAASAYPTHSFEAGVWPSAMIPPMYTQDFDVSLIPKATVQSVDMPSFADCAGAGACPPPLCPPETIDMDMRLLDCPTAKQIDFRFGVHDEQERMAHDPYMSAFHLEAALDLAGREEFH
jgi:hypothetical protein